jgi:hypothetical protein
MKKIPVGLRLTPEAKQWADEDSELDGRSMNNYVEHLIRMAHGKVVIPKVKSDWWTTNPGGKEIANGHD